MAMILPHSVIITVPKTGTTFCISACLAAEIPYRENGEGGMITRHDGILKVDPKEIEDRFSFSFGRDPLQHLKSLWCYGIIQGTNKIYEDAREGRTVLPDEISTSTFHKACMSSSWETYCNRIVSEGFACHPSGAMFISWGWNRVSGTTSWEPGERALNFIGRLDNIAEHLIRALELAGEEFNPDIIRSLPVTNRAGTLDEYKDLEFSPKIAQCILDKNRFLIDFLDAIE